MQRIAIALASLVLVACAHERPHTPVAAAIASYSQICDGVTAHAEQVPRGYASDTVVTVDGCGWRAHVVCTEHLEQRYDNVLHRIHSEGRWTCSDYCGEYLPRIRAGDDEGPPAICR